MNETLTIEDGRSVLRIERRLRHPVEKVWRALTESGELQHWFPSRVELELTVGGKALFGELNDDHATDGEVTEVDPPNVIAYTWHFDHLRWELAPADGGCLLTLTHTFDDRYGAGSFASGWNGCIDLLGQRLDGHLTDEGPADGVSPDDVLGGFEVWVDRHEDLVRRFGLDEPTVHRSGDLWAVRVERQLVRPVDAVWALLAGTTAATPNRTVTTSAPGAGATGPSAPAGGVAVGDPPPAGFGAEAFSPGPVLAADPPSLLDYRWPADRDPAGRIRWELIPGPGGARLVVTHMLPVALSEYRDTAVAVWRERVRDIAEQVRRVPVDR